MGQAPPLRAAGAAAASTAVLRRGPAAPAPPAPLAPRPGSLATAASERLGAAAAAEDEEAVAVGPPTGRCGTPFAFVALDAVEVASPMPPLEALGV
mmetsp:Transcript_130687/g.364139  ORF Transcript_130687/g.364139 Transcript_130687/m.364139 type:complete len:96 (-) Transcript_130687:278-565(-)